MGVLRRRKQASCKQKLPPNPKAKGCLRKMVRLAQPTSEALTRADDECGPTWAQDLWDRRQIKMRSD